MVVTLILLLPTLDIYSVVVSVIIVFTPSPQNPSIRMLSHCPQTDTWKVTAITLFCVADGWVGVIRSCYPFGTVRGINESNGCHIYYNEDVNFTAEYCFCDRDYCNAGYGAVFRPSTDPRSRLLTLVALVLAFLLPSVLTRPTSSSCSCALAKIAQHAFTKRTGSRTYQKEVTAAVTLSGAGGTVPLHTCVHVASTGVHEGGNPLAAPERMWRKGQSLRREHHTLLGFDGERSRKGTQSCALDYSPSQGSAVGERLAGVADGADASVLSTAV